MKDALQHWRSELVKALADAEVDEVFCTNLMCQHSQNIEIGELLSDLLSQYIRTQRPRKLEFDVPAHIACPVPQLRMFLREVQQHHEGELWLELHHSYLNLVACDDVIEALTGARWDVLTFHKNPQEKLRQNYKNKCYQHIIIFFFTIFSSYKSVPYKWHPSYTKSALRDGSSLFMDGL